MATHSSILTQEIPWTEEPGGLQSMGSQRVRYDRAHTHTHTLPSRYPHVPACPSFISFLKGNRGPKRLS